MRNHRFGNDLTRRDLLRGAAAATGGLALQACAGKMPAAAGPARAGLPGGLEVHGTRFIRDGKPFFVSGFNYWACTTLAADGNTAGWDQVQRDLDGLQKAGINMIRTMGATEGPDTEPQRIVPAMQKAPGQYDPALVGGVVRVGDELKKRGMYGIFMLNNFWQWSGGMAQYLSWAGQGPIPYPPPYPGGSWGRYQVFTGTFYKNAKAKDAFRALIQFLVPKLSSNPAVIWELANEPRGMSSIPDFHAWIDETAALIRSLAPAQLITTGSEGQTADPRQAGVDVVDDHKSQYIDFVTFHMWAQNWNWVRPDHLAEGYPRALGLAKKYINDHATRVAKLGKPLLLEEFGFPRDGGSFDPNSPTTLKDQYFQEVYALVHSLMGTTPLAGIMPWAWSGDTRPPRPGEMWKPGDPFVGDPPHEQQGWYGIYTTDTTLKLITEWSPKITGFGGGAAPTAAVPSPSPSPRQAGRGNG